MQVNLPLAVEPANPILEETQAQAVMRIFGAHRSRPASCHQKAVHKLDSAVSKMVREHGSILEELKNYLAIEG